MVIESTNVVHTFFGEKEIKAQTDSVEITIDREKCRFSMYDPLGCKKCMQVCPQGLFNARPKQKRRDFSIPKEQRQDPEVWILIPTRIDDCDGCRACLRHCPHQAITIKMNGVAI